LRQFWQRHRICLNSALDQALAHPSVQSAFQTAGATALGGSPTAFTAHTQREVARWGDLVRHLRIQLG
jgi:tripartite-type tricarboxylate transporter receptor subunit TctC